MALDLYVPPRRLTLPSRRRTLVARRAKCVTSRAPAALREMMASCDVNARVEAAQGVLGVSAVEPSRRRVRVENATDVPTISA